MTVRWCCLAEAFEKINPSYFFFSCKAKAGRSLLVVFVISGSILSSCNYQRDKDGT